MAPEGDALPPPARRLHRRAALRKILKFTVALLVVLALVLSLHKQWGAVRSDLEQLSIAALIASALLALLGVGASMLAWRTLLADMGSRLPRLAALRVYFLSQLGKYVPGSIWPVVAQMELGRAYSVPRPRAAAAFFLTLLVSVLSAVATGGLLGLSVGGAGRLLVLLPLVLLTLHPVLLRPVARLASRLLRQPTVLDPPSVRGIGLGALFMVVQWVLVGLSSCVLAAGLGAKVDVPLIVGAVALSWAAGFAVVFVPAGAGVRESVLVLLLAPDLGTARALALALLSRLAMTVADGLWALIALAVARRSAVELELASEARESARAPGGSHVAKAGDGS